MARARPARASSSSVRCRSARTDLRIRASRRARRRPRRGRSCGDRREREAPRHRRSQEAAGHEQGRPERVEDQAGAELDGRGLVVALDAPGDGPDCPVGRRVGHDSDRGERQRQDQVELVKEARRLRRGGARDVGVGEAGASGWRGTTAPPRRPRRSVAALAASDLRAASTWRPISFQRAIVRSPASFASISATRAMSTRSSQSTPSTRSSERSSLICSCIGPTSASPSSAESAARPPGRRGRGSAIGSSCADRTRARRPGA